MTIVDIADSSATPFETHRLSEASHRISNHLTLIAGMVQMQMSALSKGPPMLSREAARGLLQETAAKLVGIGYLHRRLAEQPHAESINVADFLLESSAQLVSSLALSHRVRLAQRLAGDCRMTSDQAQHMGLLVNEIILNAATHAHPTGIPVEVSIDGQQDKSGRVIVEITDDGIGLPENFDPAKDGGVGFRLIRSLAHSLKAELAIESDALGLSFRVTLPPLLKIVAFAAR